MVLTSSRCSWTGRTRWCFLEDGKVAAVAPTATCCAAQPGYRAVVTRETEEDAPYAATDATGPAEDTDGSHTGNGINGQVRTQQIEEIA